MDGGHRRSSAGDRPSGGKGSPASRSASLLDVAALFAALFAACLLACAGVPYRIALPLGGLVPLAISVWWAAIAGKRPKFKEHSVVCGLAIVAVPMLIGGVLWELGLSAWVAYPVGLFGLVCGAFAWRVLVWEGEEPDRAAGQHEADESTPSRAQEPRAKTDRDDTRARSRAPLWALAILAVPLVSIGVGVGWDLSTRGFSIWVACLAGALSMVGGASAFVLLIALALLVNTRTRRTALSLLRLVIREWERADFAAARRAAGTPGRTFQTGRFRGWTDTSINLEEELDAAWTILLPQFTDFAGLTAHIDRPLRVLCFAREAACSTYVQETVEHTHPFSGAYWGIRRKKIVLSLEIITRWPPVLRNVILHELAHHLVYLSRGKDFPVWLGEGLAVCLQDQVGERVAAPGARERTIRAMVAREGPPASDRFVATTYKELSRRQPEETLEFYALSTGIVEFLSQHDHRGFKRYLAGRRRAKHAASWFQDCFRLTYDEAMQRLIDEVRQSALPKWWHPAEVVRSWIEEELVRPIRDPEAPPERRRRSIRWLAALGYPWWANVLIELLDDPHGPLHAYALWALENIAGQRLGTDPQDWRRWLQSLTAENDHR